MSISSPSQLSALQNGMHVAEVSYQLLHVYFKDRLHLRPFKSLQTDTTLQHFWTAASLPRFPSCLIIMLMHALLSHVIEAFAVLYP